MTFYSILFICYVQIDSYYLNYFYPWHRLHIDVMYTRRRALAISAVGIGALSGCTELVMGDGPIVREASVAEVESGLLNERGFDLDERREETFSEEVSAGGETRRIEATNHATIYTKSAAGPDGEEIQTSLFGLVSTPAFEFVGQSFNPIADDENEEILEFVSSEVGQLDVGEELGETTISVLGTDTTVSKFDGTATFDDQRVDVHVYVTSVQNEEDIVVGIGGYLEELEDEEEDGVLALFEGIEHPS